MESWFLKFGRHSKLQHFPRHWRLLSWCTTNEWAKLEGDLLGLTGFPSEKSLTKTLGTPDTQYHVTKNVGFSNEKTWHLAAHESFIHAKWWNHSQLVSFAFCAVLGPNPNYGQFFSLPVIQLSSPQPSCRQWFFFWGAETKVNSSCHLFFLNLQHFSRWAIKPRHPARGFGSQFLNEDWDHNSVLYLSWKLNLRRDLDLLLNCCSMHIQFPLNSFKIWSTSPKIHSLLCASEKAIECWREPKAKSWAVKRSGPLVWSWLSQLLLL